MKQSEVALRNTDYMEMIVLCVKKPVVKRVCEDGESMLLILHISVSVPVNPGA